MAPNDEANAMGQLSFPGMEPEGGARGRRGRSKARATVSSQVDVSLPKVDDLSKSIDKLLLSMTKLRDMMLSFSTKKVGTKMASELDAACRACMGGMGAAPSGGPAFGAQPNVFQAGGRSLADSVKISTAQAVNGAAGSGPAPVSPNPRTNTANTSPAGGDLAGASAIGAGAGDVANKLGGGQGIGGLLSGIVTGIPELYGALAGGSLQYTYNRINGPTGNMNAMLQLANQLAPNVTMMNAAGGRQGGGPLSLQDTIAGLAQKMPIMGTQQDMINTILAGQGIGALMTGTPGRNGFFEAARQAQVLNPGQAPGTIAGGIAGFIGNVGAQQRGAMMGEGAFSMIGQGGSYKTLAEWAAAISKFLEQHRTGGDQGKSFTRGELITQNFPGSNINAWFQFMGVPQQMVDYWWQYALTEAGSDTAPDAVTYKTLQKDVTKARGINLGYEQLRTSTASTQRDFLFGNQMYGMYAANAAANRRFNVTMSGTDQALAQQLQGTNIGRMLALLPTPILEMLMPILTQFFTSPAGGVASAGGAIGGLFDIGGSGGGGGGILGGAKQGLISGALNMVPGLGAINDIAGMFGDPMPYGETGATNLAHLSPDLARKVATMMAANPQLQVSSGYRDTGTQNRLRAKGATAVGSNKSAHTRGWAVDIGPASQMGWLMQNAGRYGLATGANYGEPWHIQRAGTPMVGDPSNVMPYGGFGDIVSSIAGAVTDPVGTVTGFIGGALSGMAKDIIKGLAGFMESIMGELMGPIQDLIRSFVGSGSYTSMIDTATNLFSKIITAPISGISNIFGKATGGRDELAALINQPVDTKVTVVGSGFGSFGSTGDLTKPFFGDPMPFGGPMALMQGGATSINGGTAPVLIFHAPITIQGGAGGGIDAQKLANQLADRLEGEVTKRSWLVS